ncbi:transglycosylase SLT domain-containing protein [Methylomonas sp. EFPC3]|uniref:transglycosylase SLT domain-containing protein n=1 Tax=Methylomonas sp. EFPC3 TaxID=3021710 RepID=UPI002415F141|nr:transglycosylase SLT domain-containing protein [Methylomonas sp. EFPC3]WFP50427.1 transglycosylase SLT domain-containing protein [Methylomonas sp. EFPC3]
MFINTSKNLELTLPFQNTVKHLGIGMIGSLCVISQPMESMAAESMQTISNGQQTLVSKTKLRNSLWGQVANKHELDPYILYAVALVESANSNGYASITPWPWAINKSGKSIVSTSKQEAQHILNTAIAEGNRHIDVGMMQVNLYWHGHNVAKPEQLLNPVTNLEIGAKVLAEAIQSSPNNLELGIGRYHSWQNAHAAIQYGQRVIALANQIRTLI